MKTNPSGAELLAETELETLRGTIDESEDGFEGARFDVNDEDEDRLGFDDITKTKPSGAELFIETEEARCDVDDEDKLGFDDMTKTKPSGAELFVETDDEEVDTFNDKRDDDCANDDDDDEEEL